MCEELATLRGQTTTHHDATSVTKDTGLASALMTTNGPVTADGVTSEQTDAEATGAEDAAALPGAVEDAVPREDAARADVDAPADAEVSRPGGDYQEHLAAEPKTDDVEDPGGVEDTRDAETDEVETAEDVPEDATTTATNALVSTNAVSVLAA